MYNTTRSRRRPPITILPNINFDLNFDIDSDEEEHNQIITRFKSRLNITNDDNDILELQELLNESRTRKNQLNKLKDNYKIIIEKIPSYIIKDVIKNDCCSICLENKINFEEKYVITCCFHVFHEKCLKESCNRLTKLCPMCRTNLRGTFFKKFQLNIESKDIEEFV